MIRTVQNGGFIYPKMEKELNANQTKVPCAPK